MKTNTDIQNRVQKALNWEPLLSGEEIGVQVDDGIVTLTGYTDSFAKKLKAEKTAKNVLGVKAVVEKIEVQFGVKNAVSDLRIAHEIVNAFQWNWELPNDAIGVVVENGWVTLEGTLEWNYQRETANAIVGNLLGVRGITNNIGIKTELKDAIEKKAIEQAISANWEINNNEITITVLDKKVTISGRVGTLYQKHQTEKIVWRTPGVWFVENNLEVGFEN